MTEPCLANVKPPDVICGGEHCNNYPDTAVAKSICKCAREDGTIIPPPDCVPKTSAYPLETASCYNEKTGQWLGVNDDGCQNLRDKDRSWRWKKCFCCCSCLAWDTQVLVRPGLNAAIQNLDIDDTVMAATVQAADGTATITWQPRPLVFSNGTGPTDVFNSVRLFWGEDGELVCTGDQPLVTADGRYVRAETVEAGNLLLDVGGNSVEVLGVELGVHHTGLWHIATDAPVDTQSMDGHIIALNGLLGGDFVAQQILGPMLRAATTAKLGTAGYEHGRADGVERSQTHSVLVGRERPPKTRRFVAYRNIEATPPPTDAVRFVTALQAEDIRKGSEPAGLGTSYNRADFDRLVQLFRGFFPQIHIALQWEAEEPNLFAFKAYGVQTVLVNGGLLRKTELGQQGLALILAHGISRFLGAPPADEAGFACTGQADYFAIGYVLNQTYYGGLFELLEEAIPQVRALFALIQPDHRGGVDRCDYPSIDCRLSSFSAARSGQGLPHCAGAPTPGALKLEAAKVISVDEVSGLELTFNLPLAPNTVGNVVNYTITPISSVQYAGLDPSLPGKVLLAVRFATDRADDFEIVVRGVKAADGSTLDSAHSRVSFKVPVAEGAA